MKNLILALLIITGSAFGQTVAERLDDGIPTATTPPIAPTKGSLWVADGTAFIPFAIGADGKFLSADSTKPSGLAWVTGSGGGGSAPFSDATGLVYNAADITKIGRFSAASISTATTRVYTLPDVNGTMVTTGDTASVATAMIANAAVTAVKLVNAGVETGDSTATFPAITVTKTNGVAFAASATTDTTNAANISSGNLSVNRLGSGTNADATHFWRGDGAWSVLPTQFPVSSSGAGTPVILASSSTTVTGANNTIAGGSAAATLTSGTGNVVVGQASDVGAANQNNSVAIGNTAVAPTGGISIGNAAGKAGATAANFTAVGNGSGAAITSGGDNTFFGFQSGAAVTTSKQNTIVGSQAGHSLTVTNAGVGDGNTFVGYEAGYSSTGGSNTFVGNNAGNQNTSAVQNTFLGFLAGNSVTGANDSNNTFLGYEAAANATNSASGSNTVIGSSSASTLGSGISNTVLGTSADVNAAGTSNAVVIGTSSKGAASSVIIGKSITSTTTNDLRICSGDTGVERVAAGIVFPSDGAAGAGSFRFKGIATGSAPATAASTGSIYYDSTLNKFQVSENNGAYDAIATLTKAQTLTNKTLTSPTLTTPVLGTPSSGTLTNCAGLPANGVLPQTINAQSGTTYTFVAGDAQEIVTGSNAGATTFSLPTNATTAFAVNTQIVVIQTGAGAITINAVTPGTTTVSSAGATSASPILNSQYAACVCLKTATDTWIVFGNIK